ncbi:hypothetical protein N658DRAFT_511367 [Parathielavia hyrcaniae]|uniref:Uncharacterized protein n=1 Tax=Parathielavia hyrcaniae TaxID=113614 RepID=A0AAN6SX45_9PEZI|nr:hypothetical protein N658DRAFT_511367 [Parathielavia hyrcaniae]
MDPRVSTHLETPAEDCIVVATYARDSDWESESDDTEEELRGGVDLENVEEAASVSTDPSHLHNLNAEEALARGHDQRGEGHEQLSVELPQCQEAPVASTDFQALRAKAAATKNTGGSDMKRISSELAVLCAEGSVRTPRGARQPTVSHKARDATETVDGVETEHAGSPRDAGASGSRRSQRIEFTRAGLVARGFQSEFRYAEETDRARFYQERAVMEAQVRSKDALIRRQAAYIEKLNEARGRLERQLAAANARTARFRNTKRRLRSRK